MAEEIKFVDLEKWEGTAARWLAGIIPATTRLLAQGKLPATLCVLRQYRHNVYWGYHIDPGRYIEIEYCKEHNIDMGRSGSLGFGTLFNDKESNGVFLLLPEDFCKRHGVLNLDDGYREMISAIAEGAREKWGIDARHRPLNDLYVFRPEFPAGRKMCGTSAFFLGPLAIYMFYQVGIPDVETANKVLKPPPEKFADKGAEVAVMAKSTSLEEELGRKPSFAEWADAIKIGTAKHFNVEIVPWEWVIGEEPKELWEVVKQSEDMFWNDEFRFGKTEAKRFGVIPEDVKRSRYALKIPGGPLIDIVALTKEGVIKDIAITGSIHCVPTAFTEKVEEVLKGISISDEDAIKAKVDQVFAETKAVIGMGSAENLKETIIGTVRKARG
jgi:lipoate-protein ligase A